MSKLPVQSWAWLMVGVGAAVYCIVADQPAIIWIRVEEVLAARMFVDVVGRNLESLVEESNVQTTLNASI